MTTRTDTFDRADSTSSLGTPSDGGGAWTALSGTWGISSNQAYTSAAVSDSLAVLDSGSADTTVGVTVATNGSNPGLIWRASDVNNLFLWTRSGVVYRKQSGSYTSIGTRSTFTSGDVIEVDLSASTFTGWKNGVSWGADITSAFNQTATTHGLRSDNNTANRFDDFSITDAAGSDAAASADGTSTATATGASIAASAASAAGTAAATAAGAALAASDAYSAGASTGTAEGVEVTAGGTIASGAASSAGASTAEAAGASIAEAAASSAGTSTARAVGSDASAIATVRHEGVRRRRIVQQLRALHDDDEEIAMLIAAALPILQANHGRGVRVSR